MNSGWEIPSEWLDGLEDSSSVHTLTSLDMEASNAEIDIAENDFYINPVLLDESDVHPEFMKDSDGNFMFTSASVTTIFGESGTRKSFLLQTAVANHCGIMVQLESSARGVRKRLTKMNYPVIATARYVFPETKSSLMSYVKSWKGTAPTIIGFDSFAPLMALWGGDTNQDQDVQTLFNDVFHPLRNAGHCVIFLDHVPKNPKNLGFAIGSQNKKAQVDLALRIDKDKFGVHKVYVVKDRENTYEGREIAHDGFYGVLELSDTPLRAEIQCHKPEPEVTIEYQRALGLIPQLVDRRKMALDYIRDHGPIGKEDLRKHVGGNAGNFNNLLGRLVREGEIVMGKGLTKSGKKAKVLISLSTERCGAEPETRGESAPNDLVAE